MSLQGIQKINPLLNNSSIAKLTNHSNYEKPFNQGEKLIKSRVSHSHFLTMTGKYLLFFTLFQAMKKTEVSDDQKDCTSSRSGLFATKENKQLNGHVVESFESPSLLSCSHSCMRIAWCTSTNFKRLSSKNDGKGTCELNKHDISLIKENTNFREKEGIIFAMISEVNQSYS